MRSLFSQSLTHPNAFPALVSPKRLLLASSSLLLLSTTLGAVTVGPTNCTPFPVTFNNGAGGPTPVTCPAFSGPAGATLNSVTLSYTSDYQFGTMGGTNTVQVSFTPAGPAGVTFTPATANTTVTGGVSSGAPGTGTATATAGVSTANFAAPFNVNVSSQVTQGGVATSAGSVTVTYDYTAAPPPPPPPPPPPVIVGCNASTLAFPPGGAQAVSPDVFQVRYFSNLNVPGGSLINISNSGASSTVAFQQNGTQNGNLCVNAYAFSPDEQLVSCCVCPVTPDGLASLSVDSDLISNTLTPGRPTSVVVKLIASTPVTNTLASGLLAWGTTIHAAPGAAGSFGMTETPFSQATISAAELTRVTQLCGFIQITGSGFGICKSCRLGGLAAEKQ